jgi:tRNA A37 methylthiotransferase MiaB
MKKEILLILGCSFSTYPETKILKESGIRPSHPNNFDDQTYLAYKKIPQLVSHLHLPIQSGSDKILAAMKRGYTVLEYKSVIRKLKKLDQI